IGDALQPIENRLGLGELGPPHGLRPRVEEGVGPVRRKVVRLDQRPGAGQEVSQLALVKGTAAQLQVRLHGGGELGQIHGCLSSVAGPSFGGRLWMSRNTSPVPSAPSPPRMCMTYAGKPACWSPWTAPTGNRTAATQNSVPARA